MYVRKAILFLDERQTKKSLFPIQNAITTKEDISPK